MKVYLFLFLFLLLIFGACSSKQINGRQQTFTEYVIQNKYSDWNQRTNGEWSELDSECFPGLRLIKWFKTNKGE